MELFAPFFMFAVMAKLFMRAVVVEVEADDE